MNKKNLSQKELEDIAENLTDFSSGSSDVYKPSTSESDSSDDYEKKNNTDTMKRKKITKGPKNDESTQDKESSSEDDSDNDDTNIEVESETCVEEHTNQLPEWIVPSNTFVPAKSIPSSRPCIYDINRPEKPPDATKTYYVDELLSCLKHTFRKYRQDSPFQRIDESMTKFKGRSSLKQYMPLKAVKRGIKLWCRCESDSGYTYDLNVYSGKESQPITDGALTLGGRVVKRLASTIQEPDVCLCFDRFFTSVNLLETCGYAALGTCMSNRKNLSNVQGKLKRGESMFRSNETGLLLAKWQDTKEVLVLSNCHKPETTEILKKTKTGEQERIDCPEATAFYRKKKMGGVDRADQYQSLYDYDRKSTKWWKKGFYTCVNICTVNACILYKDLKRENKDVSYLTFLIDLAEELAEEGVKLSNLPLPKKGPPKKRKTSALHLPIE